jgi:hypothetical protein
MTSGNATGRKRPAAVAKAAGLLLLADLIAIPFVGSSTAPNPVPKQAAPTTEAPAPRIVGAFPLTGQPAHDTLLLDRPALSVKIDNAADALPQSGLNDADVVTEELVEGGLTRLMATFQSRDAKTVGPIRSARPEDPVLLQQFGGGLFAFSGASTAVLADVQANSGAVLLNPVAGDTTWYRAGDRPAPANLFSSTPGLYAQGALSGPPPPKLFVYGTVPNASTPARSVRVTFSGSATATWTWIPSVHAYARAQNGSTDVLDDRSTVSSINVVILSVRVVASGNYDVLHNPTPLELLTGFGPCWVMRDGVVVPGQWQRNGSLQLIAASGAPIALHPGRTWIELVPQGRSPQFDAGLR